MMRYSVGLLITLNLFGLPGARPDAQDKADLSGRWAISAPDAASTGPRRPFCARECEIKQTASTVTVTVGTRSTTYEPDGTVRRTNVTGSQSNIEVATTARWDRGALVITTTVGTQPEVTLRVALEDGDTLAVESSDAGFASPEIKLRTVYRRVR